MSASTTRPTPVTPTRPTGRQNVRLALEDATLTLLREKGTQFSIREVAASAGVNQGLIYRHFGSKEKLISAATTKVASEISERLLAGGSPVDILISESSETAELLARLILDDATSLITDHLAIETMIADAQRNDPVGLPPIETRVAIANATILGWALFGRYLSDVTGAGRFDDHLDSLRHLVALLLSGRWPDPETGELLTEPRPDPTATSTNRK